MNPKARKPSPFICNSLVAECMEHANGERSIKIYHKNLKIYEPLKATLYSPISIFNLAKWMVKASEWVGEQQVYKAKKKNKIQPTE